MIRKLLSSLYFAEIKCGSSGESLPAKWLELLLLNSQSKGRRNNQKCGLEETVLLPKKVLLTHHHTRKLLQSSKKNQPRSTVVVQVVLALNRRRSLFLQHDTVRQRRFIGRCTAAVPCCLVFSKQVASNELMGASAFGVILGNPYFCLFNTVE